MHSEQPGISMRAQALPRSAAQGIEPSARATCAKSIRVQQRKNRWTPNSAANSRLWGEHHRPIVT